MMMTKVVDVRFRRACKAYEFDCGGHFDLLPGDSVIVEVDKGLGMGTVVCAPRDSGPEQRRGPLKKVIRKASPEDMDRLKFNSNREEESLKICSEKIKSYGLPMKLVRAEYLFDSSKAIFYFTSDTRVDFRRLVKDLASAFHTRIEMKQIGVRDEAKMLGGIGPCGRELCCSSFLPDFTPVTIKMAKQQNLALNPSKISGVCGRLMCCLSYEHTGYEGGGKGRGRGRSCCEQKAGREPEAGGDSATANKRVSGGERSGNRSGERGPGQGRRGRRGVERRPEGERKTDGEKRPEGEQKKGGEKRPGDAKRPGGERRPGQGRRGRRGGDRRPGRGRRPDDKRNGARKTGGEKGPDGSGGGEKPA